MKPLTIEECDRMDEAADLRYDDWMDTHPEDAPAPWYSERYITEAHVDALAEDRERSRLAA